MEGVSSKPIGKLIVALIFAKFEQLDISHFISIPALNFCWKMEAKKNSYFAQFSTIKKYASNQNLKSLTQKTKNWGN